jgi:sulfite exporter TauE/SafE
MAWKEANQRRRIKCPATRVSGKHLAREESNMGKVVSIVIGLIFLALGVWGIIEWRAQVLVFLQAAVAIMAVIVGLGIFIFGVSELRATAEPPAITPAAPPEGPAPT